MIRVHAFGNYANRQPLAYPQIRAHCVGQIRMVETLEQADIVTVSHTKDLDAHGATLKARLSPDQRLVLLSEEPFWDTVWGQAPQQRYLQVQTPVGALSVTQLNHQTSTLYDFDRIPYFLLTHHHFRTRYGLWFRRNAQLSPQDWRTHFQQQAGQAAFVMARRRSARYEVPFCLCNQRTDVAEACTSAVRLGQGWGDQPPRQELPDWHLDKLLDLDRRFGFVGAIENTLLPNYITEKIFDAWAVGAIPLYMADAGHRVHDLARPDSWMNLLDVPLVEIPARLRGGDLPPERLEAYAAQQTDMARLFDSEAPTRAELDRLRDALVAEFKTVLDQV